ncbi:MAG: hypothetical protein ABI743_13490, partial [bacterium]
MASALAPGSIPKNELESLIALELQMDCTGRYKMSGLEFVFNGSGTLSINEEGQLEANLSQLSVEGGEFDDLTLHKMTLGVPPDFVGEVTIGRHSLAPCSEFSIVTDTGAYEATAPSGHTPILTNGKPSIILQTYEWNFKAAGAGSPAYSLIPLIGFHFNTFMSGGLPLDAPLVIEGCERNVVSFAHGGHMYYLIQADCLMTDNPRGLAYLVGPAIDVEFSRDRLVDTYKIDQLIDMLSLACGEHVGMLYFDLRDLDGNLIARLPLCTPARSSDEMALIIPDSTRGALSEFLTASLATDHPYWSELMYGVRHLLASMSDGRKLEDIFYHLSQAVECLTRRKQLSGTSLWSAEEESLISPILAQRDLLLEDGESFVRNLADPALRSRVRDWLGRIRFAHSLTPSFLNKLRFLLLVSGTAEEALLDSWVKLQQHADGKGYLWWLRQIRTQAVHGEYFDVEPGKGLEFYDCLLFLLQDTLVRALLLELGYSGLYAPRMDISRAPIRLDAPIEDLASMLDKF